MGYQANATLKTRGQIVTACFQNVGDNGVYKPGDIKLTGYENEPGWQDAGHDCDVTITRIDQGGYTMTDEIWLGWVDEYEEGEGWVLGYWYDIVNDQDVDPETTEITFDFGEALWLETPDTKKGDEQFALVSSGQVAAKDSSYELVERGNIAGNPMPVSVKAFDVSLTGYEDVEGWQEAGHDCDVTLTRIDQGGYTTTEDLWLGWVDEYDGEVWSGGFWYDIVNDAEITDESDIAFLPGEGLWVETPDTKKGSEVFTLHFPTPLANHEAK